MPCKVKGNSWSYFLRRRNSFCMGNWSR